MISFGLSFYFFSYIAKQKPLNTVSQLYFDGEQFYTWIWKGKRS